MWVRIGILVACLVLIVAVFFMYFARAELPDTITYGMSFNAPYALELGLDPIAVLDALITEVGVRHFRLAAHWDELEKTNDQFDFRPIDAQLARVESSGGTVIFGVGRRLPRWPECHTPPWIEGYSWEEEKEEIREYITEVVTRYRDSSVITMWQVENEPYLTVFATEHCGDTLDEEFLKEEIALVKSLDPTRPVLVTDSGNLGMWRGAYKHGDAFGTSVYVYFWNPELGQFRSVLPPWFYRVKEGLMRFMYGEKPTYLIELSLEPWLVEPVSAVPIDVQLSRMDNEKFDEILSYAQRTGFSTQYLWGGEWWYWLREQGNDSLWEKGKEIFTR